MVTLDLQSEDSNEPKVTAQVFLTIYTIQDPVREWLHPQWFHINHGNQNMLAHTSCSEAFLPGDS